MAENSRSKRRREPQRDLRLSQHLTHGFGPLFDEHSKILILGSFPSVKSREQQFYYGHPQNRFWKIIAQLCAEMDRGQGVYIEDPYDRIQDIPSKRELILSHGFALWDVIESCDIVGSSDSSIRNAVVTDLPRILRKAQIRRIGVNGKTAFRLFEKYSRKALEEAGFHDVPAVCLPSSSPANAVWRLESLTQEWGRLLEISYTSDAVEESEKSDREGRQKSSGRDRQNQ